VKTEEYNDRNSGGVRWNRSSDGAQRTDGGRACHARAAATGRCRWRWGGAPSPSVVRRVDGMTSVDVEALRRRRREPTSAAKCSASARYDARRRPAKQTNFLARMSTTSRACRLGCYEETGVVEFRLKKNT